MDTKDTYKNTPYESLEQIRVRKEELRKQLHGEEGQMKTMWDSMFSRPEKVSNMLPSRKLNTLMNTSVGIFDAALLTWKLYRKFKKKRFF